MAATFSSVAPIPRTAWAISPGNNSTAPKMSTEMTNRVTSPNPSRFTIMPRTSPTAPSSCQDCYVIAAVLIMDSGNPVAPGFFQFALKKLPVRTPKHEVLAEKSGDKSEAIGTIFIEQISPRRPSNPSRRLRTRTTSGLYPWRHQSASWRQDPVRAAHFCCVHRQSW